MKLFPIALLGLTLTSAAYAQEPPAGAPAPTATPALAMPREPLSGTAQGAAADAALPEAFAGLDDLTYKGDIAGMQAWVNPTSNLLWMIDPRTGVTHIGFAYGPDGASLHPEISGPAATLKGLIDGLKAQQERAADGIRVPAEFEGDINAALARLDEAGRAQAIRRLTELLANIPREDQAAYQTAIETWLAEVKAELLEADVKPAAETGAEAPEEAPEKAAEKATEKATEKAVEATDGAGPAEPLPPLHEALTTAYGLAIGPEDKPVVHALLDPSCEGCKALLREFAPRAQAGEIRLNIVLVAAAGPDSFGVISGILTSGDPVATLLASVAETDPAMPYGRVADLPEEAQAGIRGNGDLVLRYGVPSVPFVVIRTEAGETLIDGIPSLEQIAGALPQ